MIPTPGLTAPPSDPYATAATTTVFTNYDAPTAITSIVGPSYSAPAPAAAPRHRVVEPLSGSELRERQRQQAAQQRRQQQSSQRQRRSQGR